MELSEETSQNELYSLTSNARMRHLKSLSGHSGCTLDVYHINGKLVLRKTSGTLAYNRRLRRQCAKQRLFTHLKVQTPVVLDSGHDQNGMFYFDMEFLEGIVLAEYMQSIKVKEITGLVTLLFGILDITGSAPTTRTKAVFQKKIHEIETEIDPLCGNARTAMGRLKTLDFSGIPTSYCCGDLTLENIIITDSNEIYVIDLLDSFYNSWMLDVAKLLQDLELHWSYRKKNIDVNLKLRLTIAREALLENILEQPKGREILHRIYSLLLLNIMRILPYAIDDATIKFLETAFAKVLTRLEELETRL